MKLNIQLFAKKEDIKEDKDIDIKEDNPSEKIAELTISIDKLKEQVEQLKGEKEELNNKYVDEHNANLRLMERIYERDKKIDDNIIREKSKPARLSDYMDKNGRLNFDK